MRLDGAAVTPAVGDVLPPLARTIDLADMVAYAGATWDWHRLHYDPDSWRPRGLPAPVVDGQVFGALLAELVQDWLGPRVLRARAVASRFRNLVFAGETVRCDGTVAAVDGDRVTVDLTATILGGSTAVAARRGAGSRAGAPGRRRRAGRLVTGVAIVGAAESDLGVTGQVDPRRCRPRR